MVKMRKRKLFRKVSLRFRIKKEYLFSNLSIYVVLDLICYLCLEEACEGPGGKIRSGI